ncbi:IucA/IucC family protein, partial [Acinetobacter venetianus]|uniref:IucA/IucC family protein n=1 Tax=Acinetobacter venetianus TaxID=52133 RepID=UPI00241C2C6C
MGQLHPVLSNTHLIQNTFQAWQQPQSEQSKAVEQRVIKQLLQALIFEEIITADHDGESFIVQVQDRQQQTVQYKASGQRQYSYNLVRLARDQDVLRQDAHGKQQPARLNQVIDEILRSITDAAKVEDFIFELKRTYIHDLQSQVCFENYALPAIQYPYDILESYLMDGHPYHPCYKSRVGFSLQDNIHYGVEFVQPMALVWLAIHRDIVAENHSNSIDTKEFFKEQLNSQDLIQFQQKLESQVKESTDYVWIPVHPWQWENHLISIFAEEIADQKIMYLGHSHDRYLAQQSLRTVTNLQHPEKPY